MPLVDRDDTVLVVIDAQEGFFGDAHQPGDGDQVRQALARMTWLAKVAGRLGVPAVITEEDPERNGATFAAIAAVFPAEKVIVKPAFALTGRRPWSTGSSACRPRHCGAGRASRPMCCVAQLPSGAGSRRHAVVVVEDAVFSPGEMYRAGFRRMVAEWAEQPLQGLAYEWTRTLENSRSVLRDPAVGEPPFRL